MKVQVLADPDAVAKAGAAVSPKRRARRSRSAADARWR